LVSFPRLHDDVVDVDFHDFLDELAEALVHASLVGGSRILESKGHGDVAVGAKRVMKEVASWSASFIVI
jgi:hypothetical protein